MPTTSSQADRIIASDFLNSCQNVRKALREMQRYGQFTEQKPGAYWFAVLRAVWRDHLRLVHDIEEVLGEDTVNLISNRCDRFVPVRELSPSVPSILHFLLLTLHLSFICEIPMPTGALVLRKAKRGGSLHVTKMPLLRSAQRLQILCYSVRSICESHTCCLQDIGLRTTSLGMA